MMPIAVRGFIHNKKSKLRNFEEYKKTKFNKILVFDTETTNDVYQNLTFGSFVLIDNGIVESSGIFYNQKGFSIKDLQEIREFCSKRLLKLLTLEEFVNGVFYPKVYYQGYLCVGFNLPFDLSRLAISHSYARGFMQDGFSFKLTKNKNLPRLRIKHNKNKISFINFSAGLDNKGKPSNFRGNFLDLNTLVFALTNDSMSLKVSCEHFDTAIKKMGIETHGKINQKYLEYNLNDTLATSSLYEKLVKEYEKYQVNLPLTKVYSTASIGKACLNKLGIRSFMEQNPNFPRKILGYVMSTYYGGRCEVKIRTQPTKVALLDFLSMYPTVCILQDLWKFVIADKIEYYEDTENVRKFIDSIKLEDIQNKETWKQLQAIVEIQPDNDILPVRTKYDGKAVFNIGMNYLTSDKKLFYNLADVVASKFYTGKTPKILRAYRFVPVGTQSGLKKASISGMLIDPRKENFFKKVVEEKERTQSKVMKIIANSTSYGIFVEVNPDYKPSIVTVYSVNQFNTPNDKPEKIGYYYNPIIAIFITSASRLILAVVEKLLENYGTTHAFCDTDSMAVPVEHYKRVQEFFKPLNPYSFNKPLFKLQDENYKDKDPKNPMVELWVYGISAKRYVLYCFDKNQIAIQKISLHGLGHLQNPFNPDMKEWHKQIWLDILEEHYKLKKPEHISDKYSSLYALAKISISTNTIMKRFDILNKNKPYSKQIKPFNFMLVGIGNKSDSKNKVKPIVPFTKDTQQAVQFSFLDYNTGKRLKGIEYWKPLDIVLDDYKNNKECKLDGNIGILNRKRVESNEIQIIGKEATNIDTAGIIENPEYAIYIDIETVKEKVLKITTKQARQIGINRNTLFYMKRNCKNSPNFRISRKIMRKLLGISKI